MTNKNDYSDSWWQQYIDCTPGYTCADCKHACYYHSYFWFPYLDPACEIKHQMIKHDQPACGHFELIGRQSR